MTTHDIVGKLWKPCAIIEIVADSETIIDSGC
jgi:hypothetical protein